MKIFFLGVLYHRPTMTMAWTNLFYRGPLVAVSKCISFQQLHPKCKNLMKEQLSGKDSHDSKVKQDKLVRTAATNLHMIENKKYKKYCEIFLNLFINAHTSIFFLLTIQSSLRLSFVIILWNSNINVQTLSTVVWFICILPGKNNKISLFLLSGEVYVHM